MISGRQLLTHIDTETQRARAEVEDFANQAEQASNKMVELRRRESSLYRKLAELRIDSLQFQQFGLTLDRAEQQAKSLLSERRQALAELATKMAESQARQTTLEEQREQQASAVEQTSQALEKKLEEIHGELRESADYQAQQKKAQHAVDTLAAAEEKTRQAEADRQEKGGPFRSDALFMYLWQRHYGTSNYRAHLLARFFDRLLARHIRYEASRQNYHRLLEIPRRLREHTEQLKVTAQQELEQLSRMERDAEIAAGIESFEKALQQAQEKLAEIDQAIEKEEAHYQALLAEHEQFTVGEDPLYQQAIKLLVTNFRAEPIPQLRREAAETEGYEDDTLVSELAELRHLKNALQQTIDDQRSTHLQYNQQLQALADIRRRFKLDAFDAANSTFSDEDSLLLMLREFRHGRVDATRLWRALERAQRFVRYASQPSIGGLGLPRDLRFPGGLGSPRSGGLRLPRGIRFPGGLGGGGMGGSGGGHSGGGGFRTGGGF